MSYELILSLVIFCTLGFGVFILASLIKFKSTIVRKIIFALIGLIITSSIYYLTTTNPFYLVSFLYMSSIFGLIGAISLSRTRRSNGLQLKHSFLNRKKITLGIILFGSRISVIGFTITTGLIIFAWAYLAMIGLAAAAINPNGYIDGYFVFIYSFVIVSIVMIFIGLLFNPFVPKPFKQT